MYMCANSYTMTRAFSMLKELIHPVLVEKCLWAVCLWCSKNTPDEQAAGCILKYTQPLQSQSYIMRRPYEIVLMYLGPSAQQDDYP